MTKTQSGLESEIYSGQPLPWYWIDGNQGETDFPASTYLNKYIANWYFTPYPMASIGTVTTTVAGIKDKLVFTLDHDRGVMVCGTSNKSASHLSHFPGYPTSDNIRHWVSLYGYYDYGDEFMVADPAKSSVITWSSNISAYYYVTAAKLHSFSTTMGIIW